MSTGIINVLFSTMKASKFPGQLRGEYTAADIRKLVKEKFGSDNYRLIVNGKEIQDNDAAGFAEIKKTIKNNSIIYVCQRMDGGSGMVDMDTHRATILTELEDELRRISTEMRANECMICNEEKHCIRYCCSSIICKECFPNNFVHRSYRVVCLTCNKVVPPENVFVTGAFIASLNQMEETEKMARNIDFQICTCGAFAINSTMYARQKCDNCQRWLCFFCNSDWDERGKGMRNEKYSCRVNCYWETKITYQMVSFAFNENMKVPNRRCCPKCFECGAYDSKCKYHTCKCGHKFCFICLQTEGECRRRYRSSYNLPCGEVAKQSFTMFPRLCH